MAALKTVQLRSSPIPLNCQIADIRKLGKDHMDLKADDLNILTPDVWKNAVPCCMTTQRSGMKAPA